MDFETSVTLSPGCESAGLIFGSPGIRIAVDRLCQRLLVQRDTVAGGAGGALFNQLPVPIEPNRPIPLRVILEEDIAEIFLGGRHVLAARLPRTFEAAGLTLYAAGGPATFSRSRAFHLRR